MRILKKKKFVKLILSLLILITAISGWFLIKFMQNNKADDNIYYGTTEGDKENISTEIGGRIKEIKMKEGDKVKLGDLVATIYSNESSLNLENSEISIKNAENNLAKVQEGNRIEEIKAQEALVNQAQAQVKQGESALEKAENDFSVAQNNYDYKKKRYNDAKTLYESDAGTKYNSDTAKNDLDNVSSILDNANASLKNVQAQVDSYKAQLDAVTQKLNLLVNGATERDKNAVEYTLEQAKNNYEISKSQQDKSNIFAFTEGTIQSVNFNPGEYLTPGSSIATISDDQNLWVKIYVPESELPKIKIDQEVLLKSDFLEDKIVNGKIIYICPEAEFTPMNIVTKKDRMKLVYEVKVKILDNLDVVKSGMLFSVNL